MKYLFSFVFVFFILSSNLVFAKNYIASYKIKTNGILIGTLGWYLNKNADSYFLNIELEVINNESRRGFDECI